MDATIALTPDAELTEWIRELEAELAVSPASASLNGMLTALHKEWAKRMAA